MYVISNLNSVKYAQNKILKEKTLNKYILFLLITLFVYTIYKVRSIFALFMP
jgi:hypothetical protein